jgi:hypothetical protein
MGRREYFVFESTVAVHLFVHIAVQRFNRAGHLKTIFFLHVKLFPPLVRDLEHSHRTSPKMLFRSGFILWGYLQKLRPVWGGLTAPVIL